MRISIGYPLATIVAVCAGIMLATTLRRTQPAGAEPDQTLALEDAAALSMVGHVIGRADAPFRLVEFSDFQCPYCAQMHADLKAVLAEFPEELALVYRHYPLPGLHPHAEAAALAAACADEMGRFREFHDYLFENQTLIGVQAWVDMAQEAGVGDLTSFERCLSARRYQMTVERDLAMADSLGLRGTPVLIVGTRVIYGAVGADSVRAAIRRLLGAS